MSYSCLRNNTDKAYHRFCMHDCCGDDECEKKHKRWWGKNTYPNGEKIIAELSGIYTPDDLDFLKEFDLPEPTTWYSKPGCDPPPFIPSPPIYGHGMVRPFCIGGLILFLGMLIIWFEMFL